VDQLAHLHARGADSAEQNERAIAYFPREAERAKLLRFKREYCLREGIPCTFRTEDDRLDRSPTAR
jgi:hypothetical protein